MTANSGRAAPGGQTDRDTREASVDLHIHSVAFAEHARRPLPDDDCAEEVCKALAELGFEGLRDAQATDGCEPPDARSAWRAQLRREGKLGAGVSLGRRLGSSSTP